MPGCRTWMNKAMDQMGLNLTQLLAARRMLVTAWIAASSEEQQEEEEQLQGTGGSPQGLTLSPASSSSSCENLAQEVKEASSTSEDEVIFVGQVAPLPQPREESPASADVSSPATSAAPPRPQDHGPPTRWTQETAHIAIQQMSLAEIEQVMAWLVNTVADLREIVGVVPGADDPRQLGWF
ncbi:uncharacterized protein ACMZJ9_019916 [Mantella aurantiaca]